MDIKFYKPLGLKHFLLHTISVIILVSMFTMLFFTTYDIGNRKPDVIISENYKGNKILVKQYSFCNTDSGYFAYRKPIETTAKIDHTHNEEICIDAGEIGYHIKVNKNHRYKDGQKIRVREIFYPEHKYEIAK